ncbi:MAG: efflux transporter outer membrane subunit, partial [Beijerinckiaceae bacterium]
MTAMVGACAVGPDFAPPSAPVAPTWLEWRNKTLKTGDYEYRDWWRSFHDPVLDQLIAIAYAQNLTLLSAGAKVLQARAALGIAIGELYPQQQQGVGAVAYKHRRRANPTRIPAPAPPQLWRASPGAPAAWPQDL